VQGFQGFPTFPQWLGKYSTTNKSKRLTQELVVHTLASIRQSFDPIRLEYTPYLRHHLLNLLRGSGSAELHVSEEGEPVTAIEEVIRVLDDYGLSRDDLMETMKEMQFLVENDKVVSPFPSSSPLPSSVPRLSSIATTL
jgi:replication factor C subunit 1